MNKYLSLNLLLLLLLFASNHIISQTEPALQFNGFNSYVDCGFEQVLRSKERMTLSARIYTNKSNEWQSIIWCGSFFENHYAFKITPDNKIRGLIWINGPVTNFSETKIETGKWYHILFTYDSNLPTNNFKLFIDGILESQQTISGDIGEDSNPFIIGVYPGLMNQHFDGMIKDIQVWNRALSPHEIQEKMNQTLNPQNEQGLVGYWPMNEGSGNILHDITGNGNDGQIFGAEWFPKYEVNLYLILRISGWIKTITDLKPDMLMLLVHKEKLNHINGLQMEIPLLQVLSQSSNFP